MCDKLFRTVAVMGAVFFSVSVLAQDKLSGGDKKWMEKEVGAIITAQEMATFQTIGKDDRKLFKELFWMRRDPDTTTTKNEYEDIYEERIKQANDNRDFKARGIKGSESEMGQIYLLLGTPQRRERARAADISGLPSAAGGGGGGGGPTGSGGEAQPGGADQTQGGGGGGGSSSLMTWVYDANPRSLTPSGLVVEFRRQQQFGFRVLNMDDVAEGLDAAKQRLIQNPGITYAMDSDGRLMKPDDKFDPNSPAKTALAALRETGTTSDTIGFNINPMFYESNEGQTFIPMDVVVTDGLSGSKATIFGSVENADGIEIFQFEEPVELKDDGQGMRAFEMPFQFLPGLYTFYLGVMDPGSQSVGSQIVDLEIPGYDSTELSISSVLMFTDREAVGEMQPSAGKAFILAGSHLTPKRTRNYKTTDDLQGIYYAYNFVAEGGPQLTAQYKFFLGEEGRGQTAEEPVQLVNETFAVVPFGFPLSIPNFKEPGDYRVEIHLTDKKTGDKVTGEIEFTIEG